MAGKGSPKGVRQGGRQKGTPNKTTLARQAEIAAQGLTPLDYMLSVLRDTNENPTRRDDMAKAAAPYVHPKLATTTHKGDESAPLVHEIRRTVIKP